MQLYRVMNIEDQPETLLGHFGTRGDAHERAKAAPDYVRSAIRVEMLEIKNDKETLLAALNGERVGEVKNTWSLTARGGLKEVANGD